MLIMINAGTASGIQAYRNLLFTLASRGPARISSSLLLDS